MRVKVTQSTGRPPGRVGRSDGYVNMMNKYGTSQDSGSRYFFTSEGKVPDQQLNTLYAENGLFATIIDSPSEEAIKHGTDLGISDESIKTYITDALDSLDWEENGMTAIKWARLFGGAIIVMLIDDGAPSLEAPLSWDLIRGIHGLMVYGRDMVQPDYNSLYNYTANNPKKFHKPQFYTVNTQHGSFRVHESRCLVFRNGILPENTPYQDYRFWGMPEYPRIKQALREAITSHGFSNKMLERCVQAVYSMKNLAEELETDEGENRVLTRLRVIDMARGILNSIVVDGEGESYDFKSMSLTGVKDMVEVACNMLSAVTHIPQTILFGRSPAGENATGESDMENYYNYVERIQNLMLRRNLKTLLEVIMRCGLATGRFREEPDWKLEFKPLWSMSETEQANIDKIKADTEYVKAQTTQIYVDMQAIDATEVRNKLAEGGEYSINDIIDEEDISDWGLNQPPGQLPATVRAANTRFPGTFTASKLTAPNAAHAVNGDGDDYSTCTGVGVVVVKDGRILCGTRKNDTGCHLTCGPGGHVEDGETVAQAAAREAQEEFGITISPDTLIPFGIGQEQEEKYGTSGFFLCTDFAGTPQCDEDEMENARWCGMDLLLGDPETLFPPFHDSLVQLMEFLKAGAADG